jgi:hypothetical protein
MADSKITDFTELNGAAFSPVNDLFEIVDSSASANKKIKGSSILGPTPDTVTTGTYTFAIDDAFRTKIFDSASAQVNTIPTNASVAYPIGTRIRCYRKGTGSVKIVPDTGVTLRLPSGFKPRRTMGALVGLSADGGSIDASAGLMVGFDTEVYDTDGFHDNVTNNSRLTIPSGLGIKKVRLTGQLYGINVTTTNYTILSMYKNNTLGITGMAYSGGGQISNLSKNASSAEVTCADADYFELNYASNDTATNLDSEYTGFAIVVTEIDAQGFIAFQYGSIEIQKIGTDEWVVTDQTGLG